MTASKKYDQQSSKSACACASTQDVCKKKKKKRPFCLAPVSSSTGSACECFLLLFFFFFSFLTHALGMHERLHERTKKQTNKWKKGWIKFSSCNFTPCNFTSLHTKEQTRQSLGKVHLTIRSYVEILCYFFYNVCRWLIKYSFIFDFQLFDMWLKKFKVCFGVWFYWF